MTYIPFHVQMMEVAKALATSTHKWRHAQINIIYLHTTCGKSQPAAFWYGMQKLLHYQLFCSGYLHQGVYAAIVLFMFTYTSYASSLYDPRMRKYNGPHNEWTVIFVKGCLQLRHRCAWLPDTFEYSDISKNRLRVSNTYPDSKVHRANRGPIWGRQDPGGPYVGAMNFAIWVQHSNCYKNYAN